VSNLVISPAEVGFEQTVTVTADVENVGDKEGTTTLEFKIDDTVEHSEEVTLAEGESEMVTFTTTRDAEGTYTVEINGLTATFTVQEGALPTLNLGDRWVYTITTDGHRHTWTEEVTGEEMLAGRDCYVDDVSIDPPFAGIVSSARGWFEKETLMTLGLQMSGEFMGFPYVVSEDTSYEGPPLFPLEVGKQVESTVTSTVTMTIMGETETETETSSSTLEVEKIEDITVTAGTFRCFKIVRYDEYGTAVWTTWYSDKVKNSRGVKSIDNETGETMELQSYSVR